LTIRRARRRRRLGGETAGLLLLLLPYLVGIGALVVLPALLTLGLSTFEYDLIRPPNFIGFENFAGLLDDDVFRTVLRNSLLFLAIAVPLRLIAVVGLALLLHRTSMRGGSAYRAAVFLPVVVPEVAFAIAWLWILNPLTGPITVILSGLGLGHVPWLTDPGAAGAGMVLISLFMIGEAFVIAIAARRSIPPDLYDMAVVDGASSSALFRSITLPLMLPVLVLLLMRDSVLAMQVTFVPTLVITDGGPPPYATTYGPLFIYQQAFEYLRYGYAAAATAVFLALTGLVVLLQVQVLRRWGQWAWA
jgi:multiple sugar transport system permease protein